MRKLLLSALVATALTQGAIYAKEDLKITQKSQVSSIKEVGNKAVREGKKEIKKDAKQLVQEAIDSLKYTAKALEDLDKNDPKSAKSDIEKALGKLEVTLSAKDAPKLLPIENNLISYEYIGSKEDIKTSVKKVKELLDDHKVQVARELLNTLRSEIDLTIVSLPLATYPDALKLASRYIHDGQLDKAKGVLSIALSTFDRITHVIPIPLLKATDLIAASQALAKDGKKEEALKYLNSAQDQLDIAQTLGYVSKSDTTYEALAKSIKAVKKEIKGANKAEKLFEKLKKELKDFKDKIFSEKAK